MQPPAEAAQQRSLAGHSLNVAADVSLSRFRQSLLGLTHDKERAAERVAELEKRLQDQTAARKAAQSESTELQSKLEEAARTHEETARAVAAERKAHDDERARHALHARLAAERQASQQTKLQEQGQALYALEEQLRTRTSEASRLRLAQDSADGLISTFQSRLEEVSKVIEATARSETACREAVGGCHERQAALERQLREAQHAQRAAAPREQLERRLKAALREGAEARSQRDERQAALDGKEHELREARGQRDERQAALEASQRELAAAHGVAAAFEGERGRLAELLAHAKGANLSEQAAASLELTPPRALICLSTSPA